MPWCSRRRSRAATSRRGRSPRNGREVAASIGLPEAHVPCAAAYARLAADRCRSRHRDDQPSGSATRQPNITLQVYAHLFRKDDSKASDAINAALTGLGRRDRPLGWQLGGNVRICSHCRRPKVSEFLARMGGRAVEGTGLENRQGSRPSWVRIPPHPPSDRSNAALFHDVADIVPTSAHTASRHVGEYDQLSPAPCEEAWATAPARQRAGPDFLKFGLHRAEAVEQHRDGVACFGHAVGFERHGAGGGNSPRSSGCRRRSRRG